MFRAKVTETLKIAGLFGGVVGSGTLLYSYLNDSRASIYPAFIMPLLHAIDPEDSHTLSIALAKIGLSPCEKDVVVDKRTRVEIWGKSLDNPFGLAAGYDKHAESIDSLFAIGFGAVEIGSVTPKPQAGNAKPRFFRLGKDQAAINRYGFNSVGHGIVSHRLSTRIRKFLGIKMDLDSEVNNSLLPNRLLGVNLGKNKSSDAGCHDDYIEGINSLGELADYIVINISSPNTPGLRALQRREPIQQLLSSARIARDELKNRPPLLVKISPDCSDSELEDIAAVVQSVGIDGVIISNTTITRPSSLQSDSESIAQAGGLSGEPVKELAIRSVSKFYEITKGSVPIIGCGGIATAQDAIRFAKAGATFVQLYTSLGYKGPGLITEMKHNLLEMMVEGDTSWMELIGSDHK